MRNNKIDTPLRQAHFLAQIAHESCGLRYTEELASGAAYEGRHDLGNVNAGDGQRFKGRGLIQITGRCNYEAFGRFAGQDLTTDYSMVRVSSEPVLATSSATWFWNTHHLNMFADADDLLSITKRIDGGLIGLSDRRTRLERAKRILLPSILPVLQAVEEFGELIAA